LKSLRGKVAIANAKMAYQAYEEIFSGERWEKLAQRRADAESFVGFDGNEKPEKYSDVLYIEELIGKDTVNTIPPRRGTLSATTENCETV
jgi:transaldolase